MRTRLNDDLNALEKYSDAMSDALRLSHEKEWRASVEDQIYAQYPKPEIILPPSPAWCLARLHNVVTLDQLWFLRFSGQA